MGRWGDGEGRYGEAGSAVNRCMKLLRIVLISISIAAMTGVACAQDSLDTVDSRRSRVRLQGGVVPLTGFVFPLLNFNYHHRLSDLGMKPALSPSLEVGIHWIVPYADAGLTFGTDDFNVRAGGGGMVIPFIRNQAFPYATFSATLAPYLSESADVEVEACLIYAGSGDILGAVTLGVAMH